MWTMNHRAIPPIHSCRPKPIEAASVPLIIVTLRGAPASRIGSVNARCNGTSKPGMVEKELGII